MENVQHVQVPIETIVTCQFHGYCHSNLIISQGLIPIIHSKDKKVSKEKCKEEYLYFGVILTQTVNGDKTCQI